MRIITLLMVWVLTLLSCTAWGQDQPTEDGRPDRSEPAEAGALPADYKWEQAAAREGLTERHIAQLSRDKLVILARETHRQAGEGYAGGSEAPPFVTSDSLLAGYHRLYDDLVMAIEYRRTGEMAAVLRTLWHGLEEPILFHFGAPDDELPGRGQHRARFVIGVAMRLLTDEPLKPAPEGELAREIDAQVSWILNGRPSDGDDEADVPALDWVRCDYGRLTPRGFYTRAPQLRRYFRAVAWLQEVPLFVQEDESLAAVIMLVRAIPDAWDEPTGGESLIRNGEAHGAGGQEFRRFFNEFETFVGGKDDWDLLTFQGVRFEVDDDDNIKAGDIKMEGLLDADSIEVARERLLRWWKEGRPYRAALVGDVEVLRAGDGAPLAPGDVPPYFHVISALRTADAVMFTQTTTERWFPDGLEIPAALGAAEAVELLRVREGVDDDVLELVEDSLAVPAPRFDAERDAWRTLYMDYLYCLQALLDAPEPDAPPLFGSTAWKRKSLQTVCGGWAQLRHTWALQAKESGGLFGGFEPVAGFVEPDPDFYSRLADLAERTGRMLDRNGGDDDDDEKKDESSTLDNESNVRASAARGLADLLERTDFATGGAAALRALSPQEAEQLQDLLDHAREWTPDDDNRREDYAPETDDDVVARSLPGYVPKLREIADAIEKGKAPRWGLAGLFQSSETPLRERCRLLVTLCRRLETLAHKQLRGVAFSPADAAFLRGYADRLSEVMGYESISPVPDDAPWVASVFHREAMGDLQVATGRPTSMYLLYPYRGQEVLCVGVVVPYHEFVSDHRLTDEAWRGMLNTGKAPAPPDWVKGLYSDEPLREPDDDDDD